MKKLVMVLGLGVLLSLAACKRSDQNLGGTSRLVGIPMVRPVTAGFNGMPGAYQSGAEQQQQENKK